MIVEGRAVKLGDKIDTDLIIPAKHLKYTDPEYLAEHVFEALGPQIRKRLRGGIIVAGRAFGMGSSREQAAVALKAAGVKAVVASSFARIFYRNAINNGLPVIVCPEASAFVEDGEEVKVDLEAGTLYTGRGAIRCRGLSGMALEILKAGGLIEYLKSVVFRAGIQ